MSIDTLFEIFKSLCTQDQQKLIPILTNLADLVNETSIDDYPEDEKKFIIFLLRQVNMIQLTKNQVSHCLKLFTTIKNEINCGRVDYSDTFYANLKMKDIEGIKGIFRVEDKTQTKEQFFKALFEYKNIEIEINTSKYKHKNLKELFLKKIIKYTEPYTYF